MEVGGYHGEMVDDSVIMPQKHPLVNQIARAMKRRCRVKECDGLLLAVSGGADSMAMLRALAMLAGKRTWHLRLVVAHVQHHLRSSKQAEADARLVEQVSGSLKLPFVRSDLDGRAIKQASNLEAAARLARYQVLADMARQASVPTVVTAHHGDDQLETLLMRLVRGSSVKGMRGMAWRQAMPGHRDIRLIRPMLAVDRAMILDFLSHIRQPWREDSTNGDLSRWRARLRQKVLPELRRLRPDAASKAVAMADHFRLVDRTIQQQVQQAYRLWVQPVRTPAPKREFPRSILRDSPRLVATGLLRRWLIEAGAEGDSLGGRQLSPLVRMVRDRQGGVRRWAFRPGLQVRVTRSAVMVERADHRS